MSRQITILLSSDDQSFDKESPWVAKALPHERYLIGESFPLARVFDPHEYPQASMCIEPVHWHATRDHLVLLPLSELSITNEEIRSLMEEANKILFTAGIKPQTSLNSNCWIYEAGDFESLYTHSIGQAKGRNIDSWMPKDTTIPGLAKRWRKIQNEIQMSWHIHPVNEAREAQGLPRVNTVWLYGIGNSDDIVYAPEIIASDLIVSDHSWMPIIAEKLHIPLMHPNEIHWDRLPNRTFIWLAAIEQEWLTFMQMLVRDELEITLIDFPGHVRKRLLRSKDYQTPAWKFWQTKHPPTWDSLNQ